MNKILVTGATGFIGSHLTEYLVQKGLNVIDSGYKSTQILQSIERQLSTGKYPQDNLYGDGSAGLNISKLLEEKSPSINKKLSY